MTKKEIVWICPLCRTQLETSVSEKRCSCCGEGFGRVDGIWRFLSQERQPTVEQFIAEYQRVREAEGRGSADPEFYRALPFRPFSDLVEEPWRVRARSYQALARHVITPAEADSPGRLSILDLGAGNAWLSNRLAGRGHTVFAVDLLTNSMDGLGSYVHYLTDIIPVQADFNNLPFAAGQFHLAIFNASFHYSADFVETLAEALRVLRPEGSVTIMDSPFYQSRASGEKMVREREQFFRETYGFPSNSLASEDFITFARLDELAEKIGLDWKLVRPFYGLRWALRPWQARLLRRREPARFLLAVGRRKRERS